MWNTPTASRRTNDFSSFWWWWWCTLLKCNPCGNNFQKVGFGRLWLFSWRHFILTVYEECALWSFFMYSILTLFIPNMHLKFAQWGCKGILSTPLAPPRPKQQAHSQWRSSFWQFRNWNDAKKKAKSTFNKILKWISSKSHITYWSIMLKTSR